MTGIAFPNNHMVGTLNTFYNMAGNDNPWRDEDRLRGLYQDERYSIQRIADELGTSYSTIYRWMDKYDIERRTANQNMDGAWKDKDTLKKLYVNQGLSIPEVADELGCGKTTVHRWLKKHGIKRRLSGGGDCAAAFRTEVDGYERWNFQSLYNNCQVRVHRLLAIAEYGVDEVVGKHVHHKNGIKWDNRPANIELLTPSEHMKLHANDRGEV